jgi:hypothetical protein
MRATLRPRLARDDLDSAPSQWPAACEEYFARGSEPKMNSDGLAFVTLTVSLNSVASQSQVVQSEGACQLAFQLWCPVSRD